MKTRQAPQTECSSQMQKWYADTPLCLRVRSYVGSLILSSAPCIDEFKLPQDLGTLSTDTCVRLALHWKGSLRISGVQGLAITFGGEKE